MLKIINYFIFMLLFFHSSLNALSLNGNEVIFSKDIKLNNSFKEIVLIVKFSKPIDSKDREEYFKRGVEAIKYAGDLSYYFLAKESVFNRIDFKNSVGFSKMSPLYRISQNILRKEIDPNSIDEDGDFVLKVLFFKELSEDEIRDIFKDIDDLKILGFYGDFARVSLPYESIKDLLQIPYIWHIEEASPSISLIGEPKLKREIDLPPTTNLAAYELMGVDKLWSDYALDGEGVKIALVDWGLVRPTHQEFQEDGKSRIVFKGEDQTLSFHATHIGGTIGAKGVNPDAHGGAPKALIYNYLAPEISYTRAILKAYFDEKITLSHHAYLYKDPAYSGVYDMEASDIDKAVYKNPTLNVFMAGGNDRGNPEYPNWGMMRGPTNAKNVFTFGLSINGGKEIKYYSNTGPVFDGRIKPDLCAAAPGNGRLLSTSIESDTAYKDGGGTSSATARAMGSTALILQEYRKITGKNEIRHDILKALLLNTATDAGREGPDYEFGFGNMEPLKAVRVLDTLKSEKPLIKEGEIKDKEVKKYYINFDGGGDIKVTINWIDPAGDVNNKESTLVNDLDIWIERDQKIYYPFSLDKDNPTKEATANGFNRVDNSEQIVIKNAKKGEYVLYVKGYRVVSDSQKYALCS
ncbi:MAG: S8 family serine peptidase, partial [Epsilonproteobacteria bacterium]|nr:S8 family serine peptidase [Campylobacterota bacterium]